MLVCWGGSSVGPPWSGRQQASGQPHTTTSHAPLHAVSSPGRTLPPLALWWARSQQNQSGVCTDARGTHQTSCSHCRLPIQIRGDSISIYIGSCGLVRWTTGPADAAAARTDEERATRSRGRLPSDAGGGRGALAARAGALLNYRAGVAGGTASESYSARARQVLFVGPWTASLCGGRGSRHQNPPHQVLGAACSPWCLRSGEAQ